MPTAPANFTTIFPGWYSGRAVHIHFKVRVFSGSTTTFEFNSQLFFDPATANQIYATSAYGSRGTPNVANAGDKIYGSDGSKLLVELSPNASGGYDGTFVAGLSGLPASGSGTGGGTTANSVAAAPSATKFRRTASNRRILRVTSTVAETVKVKARLSRNGATIASRTVTGITSGVRALDLAVPRATGGGTARLTMTYTDGAGLTKTVRKTVKVPKKQARLMPSIGPMELMLVLPLALLVLGPKRLPGAGRAMGRGLREFKDAISLRAGADEADDTAAASATTTASVPGSA